MTKEEYILLYEKYLSGSCTDEEKKLLEDYQDDFRIVNRDWDEELMGKEAETGDHLYSVIQEKMHVSEKPASMSFNIRRWSVAAAVLLILSAGLYYHSTRNEVILTKNNRFKNDIAAGGNKAVLTLEDGSEIILDNAANGLLTRQGNVEIKKDGEGQLVYTIKANSASAPVTYNTVSTPSGGQYKVVLPDGTQVWLNAASSLRFPTAFAAEERKVELSGEAYFEVAKDQHKPFKIFSGEMEVKVLGTHFNIMAYKDENKMNTTLVEGSVQVTNGSKQQYLKAGQQASLAKGTGNIDVSEVNVNNAIAWKNGLFVFKKEDIRSVMRKVSRWYNVDVVYEGDLDNLEFGGTVSRSENVSEVLNILELTEVVHFKIEGRRITVMP